MVTEIDFLGGVISQDAINPAMKSLSEIPQPVDKAYVRRLLEAVNYFGKYIPHLSQRTTLLRSIIKKDTVFEWSENHSREWKSVCAVMSTAPLLAILDPTTETKVVADASKNGIGAALIQLYDDNLRPVAYASRTMS